MEQSCNEAVKSILSCVEKYKSLIVEVEQTIWKNPEIGYKEWKTSRYLADIFQSLGYQVTLAGDIPGFAAQIDTGRPGGGLHHLPGASGGRSGHRRGACLRAQRAVRVSCRLRGGLGRTRCAGRAVRLDPLPVDPRGGDHRSGIPLEAHTGGHDPLSGG